MDWSENQKRLIESSTLNPKRVMDGRVLEWEQGMLELAAQTESLLKNRYPEEVFVFLEQIGNEGFPSAQYTVFRILEEHSGQVFSFRIVKDGEKLIWMEDLYAKLHQEELGREIEKRLKHGSGRTAAVSMKTNQAFGPEVPGDWSVCELLDSGRPVTAAGEICIPEDWEAGPEEIRKWLLDWGLRGRVRVHRVMRMPEENADPDEWIRQNQEQIVYTEEIRLEEGE